MKPDENTRTAAVVVLSEALRGKKVSEAKKTIKATLQQLVDDGMIEVPTRVVVDSFHFDEDKGQLVVQFTIADLWVLDLAHDEEE